jgi:N-acylneuraminate cytidylyltransferase
MEMKNCIAIIPARGGSKSIPLKNLAKVGSETLLSNAIKLAFRAGVGQVYISTDSKPISIEAARLGAIVVPRPSEISSDTASTESAVLHTLNNIDIPDNTVVILIQATSPFTDFRDLVSVANLTTKGKSFFSAISFHSFLWEEVNNIWTPVNHRKEMRLMKQQLNETVLETGNFYSFHSLDFLEEKSRFCKLTKPFIIKPYYNFQIDSMEDLKIANKMVHESYLFEAQ